MDPNPNSNDDYIKASGFDAETKACVRACEPAAAAKTASDYAHIVWAYAVLWALFAGYGALLWRRQQSMRADLARLRGALPAGRNGSA